MKTQFCFLLEPDYASAADVSLIDRNYQNVFKRLLFFLRDNSDFQVSIGFTGPQLSYYNKNYPESIVALHDFVVCHQVEIIGGGFHSPIFPLLSPLDRTGQVEKMNSLVKSCLGKRPCGIRFCVDAWDPCLISSFHSCGMQFAFLDSLFIPQHKRNLFPLISSEQGKHLKIFPIYKELLPEEGEKSDDWALRVEDFVCNKIEQSEFLKDEEKFPLVSISFSMDEFDRFMRTLYLDVFLQNENFSLSLPSSYLKKNTVFLPAYIPSCINTVAAEGLSYLEDRENHTHSIYDFFESHPESKKLYLRTIYVSLLISQCKGGDKARKSEANELLWQAQGAANFFELSPALPPLAERQQKAYRVLNEAERLVRDAAKSFSESLTSFDYDGDGSNEYVCQMEKYGVLVSLKGARVSDFNLIKGGANYAAASLRSEKYDGISETQKKGLFVDRLLDRQAFLTFLKTRNSSLSFPFANIRFSEKKLDYRRKQLHTECHAFFPPSIPVYLRKSYTFFSDGISVQYILRNEGDEYLDGIFAVEICFAQTRFEKKFEGGNQYSAELILDGEKKDVNGNFDAPEGLSFFQLRDSADKCIFIVEPNEDSGVSFAKISCYRPASGFVLKEASSSRSLVLFWDISLPPSMEKEKTVNFSVIPIKKQ